jgi:uncharacterized membrane protein
MFLKIAYVLIVILALVVEHYLFGKVWRYYELARWVMGVITVMVLALPLALIGEIDFATWLLILFGFGFGGAAVIGLYIHESALARQKHAQKLRGKIDEQASEITQH